MSYELDNETLHRCPCGAGFVVERSYSNDWFQHKHTWGIACDPCGKKYRVSVTTHSDLTQPGTWETAALVPTHWPEAITQMREQIKKAQDDVVMLARGRYRYQWVARLKECRAKSDYHRALGET